MGYEPCLTENERVSDCGPRSSSSGVVGLPGAAEIRENVCE